MRNCSFCHKEFSDDLQFCPFCGHKKELSKQRKSENVIALLGLAGILGWIYFLLANGIEAIFSDFDQYVKLPFTSTAFVLGCGCLMIAIILQNEIKKSKEQNPVSDSETADESNPNQ